MKTKEEHGAHRVLVIDDNTAIHEDFRKILMKAAGSDQDLHEMEVALFGSKCRATQTRTFVVDCVAQGKEGLELVRQAKSEGRPYSLAFVDGRMPPGWDGIETIGRLWQECPELQVVLCTAYADYSWQDIQDVLGETDSLLILKKPFDNVEVLQLAHALARKWDLSREVQGRIDRLNKTVYQRTEEKEHTEALLQAALEHSPAGIIISDAEDLRICWSNPAALRICCSPQVFVAPERTNSHEMDWQIFRADGSRYPQGQLPLLRATVKGEIIQNEELMIRDRQGHEKWISSNAAPIHDAHGGIGAGILVFQDVSERKRSEEEREELQKQLHHAQRMESVGLLAGGVAHDFNNMLGVILGHAELALDLVESDHPVHAGLRQIKLAADRSAELTRQLLAFARKQTVVPKVLDLNEAVTNALKMLRRLIGEDIQLHWKPGRGLWSVKIDPGQIDQLLSNLCVNARDAIDGIGEVTIETDTATLDESYCVVRPGALCGDYVMLAVSDNGCGMEKNMLEHIFEPFFSTKELHKGTGLGLATVYGIVKQNKGGIDVASEPGKGSTFKIYLPRYVAENNHAIKQDNAGPAAVGHETILLVEDEPMIRDMAKKMLESLTYTVLAAGTPGEAIRLTQDHVGGIDLLMTDVVMPGMNGRDLASKLQPRFPGLKCLFMSGYTANVIARRGILDESINFIQKPFSIKDLAKKVRALLETPAEN